MIRSLNHLSFFSLEHNTLLSACIGICFAFHAPAIALNKPTLSCLSPFIPSLLFLLYFYTHFSFFFLISPCRLLPPPVLLHVFSELLSTSLPYSRFKSHTSNAALLYHFTVWLLSPEQIQNISHCCLSNYLPYELCSVLCIQCQRWVG